MEKDTVALGRAVWRQRRAQLVTEVPDVARGGADVFAGREPGPRSSEVLGLAPAVPLLQSARDPLERLARQGRRDRGEPQEPGPDRTSHGSEEGERHGRPDAP
jgi:hypothetical protein